MKYYKNRYGTMWPKMSKKEMCKEMDIMKEALRRLVSQVKALATELGYTFDEKWTAYHSAQWTTTARRIIHKLTATEVNKKKRR